MNSQAQVEQIATTGFLDTVVAENEKIRLGGWVISFAFDPVDNFIINIGDREIKDFEVILAIPSPDIEEKHRNLVAAKNARFLIQILMSKKQQQQFQESLISVTPLIKGCRGETLLNAVVPCLATKVKKLEALTNLEKPQVEIISVHVPKAAGHSFRQVLLQVYAPWKVMVDKTKLFEKNLPPIPKEIKVIDGHFCAGKYDRLFPDAKKIIWLRQPIRRLISAYFLNIRTQGRSVHPEAHIEEQLFLKFARKDTNKNIISKCLDGKELSEFFFVGITELFEEDIKELKALLNWSEFQITYQNKNPYPEYKAFVESVLLDQVIIDELTALNSQDIEIYKTALSKRETRRKKLGLPISTQAAIQESQLTIRQPKMHIIKPLATLGEVERVGLKNQGLYIKGWVSSINSGAVQEFKVDIGGKKFDKFEQTLNISSPDIQKIRPYLDTAEAARFELVIPIRQENFQQWQQQIKISLTPLFKNGKGTIMIKDLSMDRILDNSSVKIQQQTQLLEILPKSKTLPSVGNFDEAVIQNQKLRLSGWVASLNSASVDGFQISIAGQEITEFEHSLGLPSPDVKKAFPKLDNAEVARFEVLIPVSQLQMEEFDDSVVALTPLFKDGKGVVMVKVISVVGGGNKTVDYKIVDSDVILSDGK
ncbi:MAG: sulfotransferase family 2 domain-containing protein, partial [Cyclobacteriaceae bacterium]